ncbi:MAG: DNA mismatch repair endonuclease MutL [Chloroflexi bacterium]|nr:DNA mismatch repair endonuclease MutL [Chloroflexota bacterium]
MPIRVLPPEVAAQIAAGEVVERPVSVVKELLENAIDADADDIAIDVLQGGRRLVRVRDDGCGIVAAEAELAFQRHATSKIESAEDLYRVRTLGFRGEALASIAAVSRLTLSTRAAGEEVGTLLRLEGGRVVQRELQARPVGTTVQVENLFFNTPARLKFLRADATEAGHIARLVSSYALAYPSKRILLQHNEREVLRTTGTGQLFDVLVTLYGLDVAEEMVEIPEQREGEMRLSGYVGLPSLHRSNSQELIFFVNRRWIQDRSLAYAVREAYHALLPQNRYPVAIVSVELPPEEVDVNIHPTKQEVRFRHARAVFTLVQRAVRSTLMGRHPFSVVQIPAGGTTWREERRHLPPLTPEQARLGLEAQRTGDISPGWGRIAPTEEEAAERLPMLRVIGQIAQTYIVAEGPGGLYLIDQHAAHERIRYETLKEQRARRQVASQELLDPVPVELSPQQAILLEEHLTTLADFGLEVIPFGGTTFLVKRVPASLAGEDIPAALIEMLDAALEDGRPDFSWEEQALITLSCHTAVRAGQTLAIEEMRDLVRQLERSALPHSCPHGRPTVMHMSHAQIAQQFARR